MGCTGRFFFPPFSLTVKLEWKPRMWEDLENLVEKRNPFFLFLSTTSLNSLLCTPPHSNLLEPDFVEPWATVQVQVALAWALVCLVKCICSPLPNHCPQPKSSSKIFLHSRMLIKASPLLQSYSAVRGYSQYKCWWKLTRLGLLHTLIMSMIFWVDFHDICGRTSQNTWKPGLTTF